MAVSRKAMTEGIRTLLFGQSLSQKSRQISVSFQIPPGLHYAWFYATIISNLFPQKSPTQLPVAQM